MSEKNLPTPETLEAYTAIKNKPYAFEYFGVEPLDSMPTYQKWAEIVDSYVKLEMENKSYEDSIDIYKEILGQVSQSIGLDDKVIGAVRLRRVAQWIRDVIQPMRNIEIKKRKILYADS